MLNYLLIVKLRNWDEPTEASWLGELDLPADPIGDLRTKENSLSVWQINKDNSNLDLVVVALATNRVKLDKFEFGLFDEAIVRSLGIHAQFPGPSFPLPHVPLANQWHRDLIHLTADKLVQLGRILFSALDKQLLLDTEVADKVRQIAQAGLIRPQRLNAKIRPQVDQLIAT